MHTMKNYYISFGQAHAHSVGGKTYDKDCIALLKAESKGDAHDQAMEIFKGVFCFVYDKEPDMSYFPRGIIEL